VNTIMYFLGKDLAAMVEIYLGAAVFTAVYWPLSGLRCSHHTVFWCAFAFNYAVWGISFIWSIVFEPASAQIITVVTSFVCFLTCGVQPKFYSMLTGGSGFMVRVMACSPERWAWAFLMADHTDPNTGLRSEFDNGMIRNLAADALSEYGMPLAYMYDSIPPLGCGNWPSMTVEDKWLGCTNSIKAPGNQCLTDPSRPSNGLVCTLKQLFLLGFFYRAVALTYLITLSRSHSKGGSSKNVLARLCQKLFNILLVVLSGFQLSNLVNTTSN